MIHKKGITFTEEVDLSRLTSIKKISDDGIYYFYNSGSYGIRVQSGNPTIYLDKATISVTVDNAIDILDANPIIHVIGNNTVQNISPASSDNAGSGIFVKDGSTVTITGNSRNDKLTVRGANGGSGIGGSGRGDILIKNVRVDAYGSYDSSRNFAPGIGGAANASCGTITIDNATVYAYGTYSDDDGDYSGSAIGCGVHNDSKNNRKDDGSFEKITIRNNSKVHAKRGGGYSMYIGYSGSDKILQSEVLFSIP